MQKLIFHEKHAHFFENMPSATKLRGPAVSFSPGRDFAESGFETGVKSTDPRPDEARKHDEFTEDDVKSCSHPE